MTLGRALLGNHHLIGILTRRWRHRFNRPRHSAHAAPGVPMICIIPEQQRLRTNEG
jgi:hypothetical protein